MRIVKEHSMQVLWEWDDRIRDEFVQRYGEALEQLVATVHGRLNAARPVPKADLAALAKELQAAAEILLAAGQHCLDAAGIVHTLTAGSTEEQAAREAHIERLRSAVGKPVVITRTSIERLRGCEATLEELRGMMAVLRVGEERWETPAERVAPVAAVDESQLRVPAPTKSGPSSGGKGGLPRAPAV